MALDHSRLGLENKFLENKSGESFTFDKFTLQNLANKYRGCVNQPWYFSYITSEVKQFYEALYLSYRPRTECSISQFLKTNCTQSIFGTINRGLLSKLLKKFPKSPIDQLVLTFDKHLICSASSGQVFEWTLLMRVMLQQHHKEFIMFVFF